MFKLFLKCFLAYCSGLFAATEHPDEVLLKNVEQLTFPSMGFEKAGEAYFSPDGTMICFQATPKGKTGYQIFIMELPTRQVRQISQGVGTCTCSYFHPTEKKILFAASPVNRNLPNEGKYKWDLTPYMNLYEADLDGNNLKALTQGAAYHAECAYSPDGTQVVYASNEDGSMNLYIVDTSSLQVRQLTHTSHCYNGGPFFSPDGSKIVFRADPDIPNNLQIYVMHTDGSNLVQLTNNQAVNWAPFWHPNQDVIAYTTSLHGHYNYEVYLLSMQKALACRVTHHPAFDGLASFNKEGTKMLWTSKRGEDGTSQVFIADFTLPSELEIQPENAHPR